MSFLDDVQLQNGTNGSAPSGGSFLDSIQAPPANEDKIYKYQQEANQAKQESDKANSIGTLFRETMSGVNKTLNDSSASILDTANEAVKNTWETYRQFPGQFMDDLKTSIQTIKNSKNPNPADKGNAKASALDAGSNMVNALMPLGDVANELLAPISAAFGAVMQQTGGQKLVDATGNTIVDKSGITDMPAFQNYAMKHPNFARKFNNMLLLLTVGADKFSPEDVPKQTVDAIHNLAKETIEQAKPVDVPPEPPKPKLTPEEKQAAYAKSQGYEPYTPADKLPVIDAGKPAKSALPTIQIGESIRVTKNSTGDLVYEPIKEPGYKPTPEPAPESISVPAVERPVLPDGTRVSKGASDINASLIQKGFTPLTPEEQTRYGTTSQPEQDTKIAQLISNPEALDSAIKNGDVPDDITKPLLFKRLSEHADSTGNTQMSLDLAKSPLAKASSETGQALGLLKGTGDTSADAINEVKNAREVYKGKKATEQTTSDVEKTVNEEVAKTRPTKKSWSDFIESIKCNY